MNTFFIMHRRIFNRKGKTKTFALYNLCPTARGCFFGPGHQGPSPLSSPNHKAPNRFSIILLGSWRPNCSQLLGRHVDACHMMSFWGSQRLVLRMFWIWNQTHQGCKLHSKDDTYSEALRSVQPWSFYSSCNRKSPYLDAMQGAMCGTQPLNTTLH